MPNVARFREFAATFDRLVGEYAEDAYRLCEHAKELLADLVAHDDWLPAEFAVPDSDWYQQYLLYLDPWERFSIISVVWDEGQGSPIYDLSVWGMISVMEGTLQCRSFRTDPDGNQLTAGGIEELAPGDVYTVLPRTGSIHQLSNSLSDRKSVSVHVYGANIATVKRYIYDSQTGHRRKFLSTYSNPVVSHVTQSRLKVLLDRI